MRPHSHQVCPVNAWGRKMALLHDDGFRSEQALPGKTHASPLPGVSCIVETFEYVRQPTLMSTVFTRDPVDAIEFPALRKSGCVCAMVLWSFLMVLLGYIRVILQLWRHAGSRKNQCGKVAIIRQSIDCPAWPTVPSRIRVNVAPFVAEFELCSIIWWAPVGTGQYSF